MHYAMGRRVALVKLGFNPMLAGAGLGAAVGGTTGALVGKPDDRLTNALAGGTLGAGIGTLTMARPLRDLFAKSESLVMPPRGRELGEEARLALRNEAAAFREANPNVTKSMGRYTPPETGEEVLLNYMTGSIGPVPPGYNGWTQSRE